MKVEAKVDAVAIDEFAEAFALLEDGDELVLSGDNLAIAVNRTIEPNHVYVGAGEEEVVRRFETARAFPLLRRVAK